MTRSPDTEFEALEAELKKARSAEVPNLAEVRRCRNEIIDYIARCVWECIWSEQENEDDQLPITVISNDAPEASAPRGICSPVKSDDIREFEESLRTVFGDIKSCTTAWGGH